MKLCLIILILVLTVVQINCIQNTVIVKIYTGSNNSVQDRNAPTNYVTEPQEFRTPNVASGEGAIEMQKFENGQAVKTSICVGIRGRTGDRSSLTIKASDTVTLSGEKVTPREINDIIASTRSGSESSVKIYVKCAKDIWRQLDGNLMASLNKGIIADEVTITCNSLVEAKNLKPVPDATDLSKIESKVLEPKQSPARVKFFGQSQEWETASVKNSNVLTTHIPGILSTQDPVADISVLQVTCENPVDAQEFLTLITPGETEEKVTIFITTTPESSPEEQTTWVEVMIDNAFVDDTSLIFDILPQNNRKVELIIERIWPHSTSTVTIKVPAFVSEDQISIVTHRRPREFISANPMPLVGEPTWEECLSDKPSIIMKEGREDKAIRLASVVTTAAIGVKFQYVLDVNVDELLGFL